MIKSCNVNNDPKAGRSILALIAQQKTAEKMAALYAKYKESGLTVGELRKKAAKPKLTGAPVDLTFVDQFYDRIYLLESETLTNDQKVSLNQTIVKMRSMLLEKTHKLKLPVQQQHKNGGFLRVVLLFIS